MPLQGGLTIERMCHPGQVSRAGFYRWLQEPQPRRRRRKYGPRFSRSQWNIGGVMAIGAFLRNSDVEVCP